MNNKKVNQEERKAELKRREELEKLIESTSTENEIEVNKAKNILTARRQGFLNYHDIKITIDKEANKIVKAIAGFYLDTEIISSVPYVKQKTKVDIITVSSLLFQMRTAEHAIIKLLGEIDDGNLHPRTFEVLASLQRSKMEIVKHLAQFMLIMENAYKAFKDDYRVKKSESATYIDESSDDSEGTGFRTRGSRALIQAMTKLKNEQKEEDDFTIEDVKDNAKRKDT